jgi:hypothetical protein
MAALGARRDAQEPRKNKSHEGGKHEDRNEQFEHINTTVKAFQDLGEPVISIDAKKKELVGNFASNGREWQPKGRPEEVNVYDWRGRPLISRQVVVNLMAQTTTKTGLRIHAGLDESTYPTKQQVSDAEMEAIKITRNQFHGEWNDYISP